MAVRSIRLGAATLSSGTPSAIYTVPAGARTILRTVNVFNTAGQQNRVSFDVRNGGTTMAEFEFMLAAGGTLGEVAHEWVWIVLNAGEVLRAWVAFDGAKFIASGAQLNL